MTFCVFRLQKKQNNCVLFFLTQNHKWVFSCLLQILSNYYGFRQTDKIQIRLFSVLRLLSHVMISVRCLFTADARQPWTDSQDCYFEYLIIHFDYLIIPFDYLIIG